MEQEDTPKLDLGSLGSFDFSPSWAKKDAGVTVGKVRPERTPSGEGDPQDERRPQGERKSFGDRKPFGERKPFGDRKPFGERKPFGDRKQSFGDRKQSFGERKPFAKKPFDRAPRAVERPLELDVKVLPETKALGTIIRKLQGDVHAYKLKDLAYFFLDNPQSVLLKITPKAQPAQPSQAAQAAQPTFFQCRACGFASTREDDVLAHALAAHLSDYYDAKEIEVEPPKGNFNCVAKCGLSGVLLGPPNIHEFNATVREMIRTKYPDMSEEQYRSHIEMVRDADAIEEWRKGATKKTVFFPKGQADTEGAASLSREQAEGEFRRTVLPSLVDHPKHLMLTADVALKSPVKPLVWAVNDALEAERRAPYGMCFALHGAFRHRKLNFFRANDARGPEFVTSADLKPFDAAHAIPELAALAKFIGENPCCDRTELPPGEDTLKLLQWLVSTGHVVAFAKMGVYSAVEKFPKYGPQWKKRAAKRAPAAEAPAAEAPAEAPVAETPAAPEPEPEPPVAPEPEPPVAEAPAAPEPEPEPPVASESEPPVEAPAAPEPEPPVAPEPEPPATPATPETPESTEPSEPTQPSESL